MHIASGGTINFGNDSEKDVSRLQRKSTVPLAHHGRFQKTEALNKGLWPSFNVSKFQGFEICKDTESSGLHTLCDLSWDKVVLEQLSDNTTIFPHSGCAQGSCRLCQHIIRSVHRWQISREMIQNWIARRDTTPKAFIPLAEKAVSNIDSDLAKLHSEQQKCLQQSFVHENRECSLDLSETIARNCSPPARKQRINLQGDIDAQVPSNGISRLWKTFSADVKCLSILPRTQSNPILAGQPCLKAPPKLCIGPDSQRLLNEILSSFCWDPLRGLTIVRSCLVRCGVCRLK